MKQLSVRTKLGYGVGDLGGNLYFTMTGFFLLFYLTEILGIPAAIAGVALMIGKIWDAITDPVVGHLSDATRSRHGRRRPWMFAGIFVLFGSMIMMFSQPPGPTPTTIAVLFGWVVLANSLLNLGYTFINIPYSALAPDLTTDFHERTELNGYRMSFAVVGTFIGASAILPLVTLFGGGDATAPAGWTGMAVVIGGIIAITTTIVILSVREPQRRESAKPESFIRSYIDVLKLRPFQLAVIPWALHITGVNVIQGALLYYFRFIYRDEAAFQVALPILLASALIFIPVWVKISKRIGKKASYNIGMSIFAGGVILFFLIGHLGGPVIAFIIMGVSGIGFATQYVMPYALVPDIVEYDYADSGIRREGAFYGMWTFSSKIGQAVGLALNGAILSAFGYIEASGGAAAVQPDSALLGIRIISGPLPATFFILGVLVLRHYPITTEVYEGLMERIRLRDQP